MKNQLSLVKPTPDLEDAYLSFYREWLESGELMVPWVISRDPSDFPGMVKWLQKSESGLELRLRSGSSAKTAGFRTHLLLRKMETW